MAAGRGTGLVLDCGHLESTVLPVSHRHISSPNFEVTQ